LGRDSTPISQGEGGDVTEPAWNADEVEKVRQSLEFAEEKGDADALKNPVETLATGVFRSRVGQLRGGETAVIVTFRGKPAAIATPHPIDAWKDSKHFVARMVGLRNTYLSPPYHEPGHPWADGLAKVELGTMEQVRRKTAQVFAHVLRNTVFVMTYYDEYEVMSLIPIPPDMPEPLVQIVARSVERLVTLPLTGDVLDVSASGRDEYKADFSDGPNEEIT
jgi:hypothetical protein